MSLKLFLRYPMNWMLARQILKQKDPHPGNLSCRPLVLDLKTPQMLFDGGRHLFTIAYYSSENGTPTYLRCSGLILSGIAHKIHGKQMLEASHVGYLHPSQPLPKDALILRDHEVTELQTKQLTELGHRCFRMKIGRDLPTEPPVMPYPMHPYTLQALRRNHLATLRQIEQRECLVLFAGCQKSRYGTSWMEEQFKILSRLDCLKTVRETFSNDVVQSMEQAHQRTEQSRSTKEIRILDSKEHPISAKNWLPTLAKSHFFLCGPGGRQPICHNLVESMAVGTIPIIEYGDRIHPELIDGENAICFQGKAGLIDAIHRIRSMNLEEISQLQKRVGIFHDQHLCGKQFFGRLLQDKIEGQQLAMPFHEKNFD